MPPTRIPVSAVIATRNRAEALGRTLDSLSEQRVVPGELIVVDASEETQSRNIVENWAAQMKPHCAVLWERANEAGAAIQRNQGVALATQPFICFFDDDIVFEPDCVKRLWDVIERDSSLGGVNAMIVNQRYQPPGLISRVVFTLMQGHREESFAGKVIGPAINLLPADREDLPDVVPVEWLNTTCTLYRRAALPVSPFDSVFRGYSLFEDLTLSLRVSKHWRLANVRTARIFHDSQPGMHKASARTLAAMELVNRHYVMTQVLQRTEWRYYFGLLVWEIFQFMGAIRQGNLAVCWNRFRGKVDGLRQILGAPRRGTKLAGRGSLMMAASAEKQSE